MSIWHGNTLCEEELEELEKTTVFDANEIESLYERFRYLDRGSTGFLTFAEFQMIPEFYSNPFSRLHINRLESFSSFEKVCFATFVQFLEIFNVKTPVEARISFLFDLFDIDGDKRISRQDLSQILFLMIKKEDQKQVDEVLELYDLKKKGYLDYSDFIRFYESDPSFEKNMILDFKEYEGTHDYWQDKEKKDN